VILSHTPPCSCKSKEKEKEKKRNINSDLAILPCHDTEEDVPPMRYGLRRSTHETRVPHREGNIYGENRHPIDVLRYPKWRQHPGEADLDMACRMLENARRHIQAQPDTIHIVNGTIPLK